MSARLLTSIKKRRNLTKHVTILLPHASAMQYSYLLDLLCGIYREMSNPYTQHWLCGGLAVGLSKRQ